MKMKRFIPNLDDSVLTGFEQFPHNLLVKEIDGLFHYTKKFLKSKRQLENPENKFDKTLYIDTYLLADRFVEFYEKNKWKFSKEKIDEYTLHHLKEISKIADEYQRMLGIEKNSYIDYEYFRPQESLYNICRQYCIDLSVLCMICIEIEKRYFSNGNLLQSVKKEPSFFIKVLSLLPGFIKWLGTVLK